MTSATCNSLCVSRHEEVELAGGNITKVVRVGDTVRREAGSWTPMVHQLLNHVRGHGYILAPEPLGLDDARREVLSYISGETLQRHPWPEWIWSEALLGEAARTLADYHDAVADFRPLLVESRLGSEPLADDEIVCHNDFAPYNVVFGEHHVVGIIDWDVVCAGSRSWDLAFFAWHWIPLHAGTPEIAWRSQHDCQRRLRLVVDAYGLNERAGFVDTIIERIEASRSGIIARSRAGDGAFARLEHAGHAHEMERALDFVHSIEHLLVSALSD